MPGRSIRFRLASGDGTETSWGSRHQCGDCNKRVWGVLHGKLGNCEDDRGTSLDMSIWFWQRGAVNGWKAGCAD